MGTAGMRSRLGGACAAISPGNWRAAGQSPSRPVPPGLSWHSRVLVAVLAVVLLAPPALADLDSKGTDFWLAFPENYTPTPELRLFLASDGATTGKVSVPGIGFETSFTTASGQITTVSLPPGAQLTSADGVQSRGIHVEANGEISVYGLNRIQYTTDAYLGLPTDILGSEYMVMSHPGVPGYGSELAVVAPHADTTVTITPSIATGSRQAGVPFTVSLAAGDAYQLRATGSQDLSGTSITANKPIAAFGAARCVNVPVGYSACDHLVEQLTPPNTWGTKFAAMPLATRTRGDTFRFLAASDGTEVLVNGEHVATLSRGQVHQRVLEGPSHVLASKPILVAQFSNGQSFDGHVGDPFMMLIPPYEQFLSRYTIATPASGFAGHYVNVVAPASAVGQVEVDGNAVPASEFVAIGDSGFSGAQVPIATGSHTLTGPTQIGAFVYGFGSYDSYGYPAGLSLRRLSPISTLFGMRRSAGWANDPVNTGTGNFVTEATDLQFESIWGLDLGRTYNALDDVPDSALGRGWSLSVQKWVTEDVDGTVWLHEPDGRVAAFRPEGSGYTRPEELFGSMRRDDDNSLSIAYFDGSVDDFGPEGRLTERRNWDGQVVSFTYDDAGNVKTLAHSSGKSLTLAYDPPSRLASATTDDGRKVAYTYDTEGDLASVTDAAGGVTRYDTDARGLITRIVDPADRLVVTNTYDGVRRVVTQKFPAGGTAEFSYNIASRVTTVTDGSTGEVTRYAHDQQARLLAVTDATGATLTKSYDEAGNLVSVTDRRDASLHTRYDSHGNVVGTTDPLGAQTTWVYDDQDRLVSETDAEAKTTTYAYDGNNRIPSKVTDATGAITTTEVASGLVDALTDADGVRTAYGYDAARNLVSITDALGGVERLDYDGAGRPTSVTEPSGATARTSYDALGRPLSETDGTGATTSYSYDPSGMLVSDTDPTGAKNVYVYDAGGNLVEAQNGNGAATTYTYDANGELTSVTEPGGATTRYQYGPLARLEAVTDPTGAVTRFGYDAGGNLLATTEADGAVSKTAYDLKGRVVSETDPLGNVTSLAYDALDRLVSESDPTEAKTSYTYDAVGRLASVTDPRGAVASRAYTPAGRLASETDTVGAVTRHAYDNAGRLSTITDPLGGVTALTYDADGEVVSSRSPAGLLTSLGYDAADRITKITEPGGGVTTRTLTPRGELATETDPTGANRSFAYDAIGNLTEAVDANGGRTTYSYDSRGNRVSRTNAAGGTDKWAYDLADRLIESTDPLDRTTAYEYDGLGRLLRSTDPSGRSETLTYDVASQVVARAFADGSSVTYAYDALGRRTQMVDAEGTTSYAYDIVGNLTEVVRPGGERLAYSYDVADRRTSVTYPDGSVATSTYDANGREASVAHATLGTTNQSWDADGRLVGEALPGGASRSFGYDAAGRLASFKQSLSGADRTTTLARDAAGRIISETTGSEETSYTYDKAGELLGATGGGFTGTYAYDALGRRTSSSSNGVNSSYAYDPAGQLLSQTVNGSTGNYSYDEAGRRTSAKDDTITVNYRYGSQGELSRIESLVGTETTVEERNYDGDGGLRGIVRTEPTGTKATTKLTWDAGVVVPEILTMSSGTATTDLVYGAQRIGAVTDAAAPALFAIDAHGSTISTAATSAFAVAGRYDPYGNPLGTVSCGKRPVHPLDPNHCAGDAKAGNPPNVGRRGNVSVAAQSTTASPTLGFGYRGELHVDSLVHLRARDYEPSTGLFTLVDPLPGVEGEVTAASPYPYATNDPLNQIDPLGLTPLRDSDMGLTASAFGNNCRYVGGSAVVSCNYTNPQKTPGGKAPAPSMAAPECPSGGGLQKTGDFFSGVASNVPFDPAKRARKALGADGAVNYCSGSYRSGQIGGFLSQLNPAGAVKGGVVGVVTLAPRAAKVVGKAAAPVGRVIGRGIGKVGSLFGRGPKAKAPQTVLPTPSVGSTKLQNIVKDLYKGTVNPRRIGTGTTADALRYELRTGQRVFGKSHLQKAQNSLRGLENWLKANPNAPYHDRLVARSLADDLLDALGRAP